MPGFDLSHLIIAVVVGFLVLGPEGFAKTVTQLQRALFEAQRETARAASGLSEKTPDEPAEENATAEQNIDRSAKSIVGHLQDLRQMLLISIIAIIVTTSIAYVFSDTIIYILRAPAGDIKLRAFSPMDGFLIHLRVALYGGIFMAAPIWIWQLMRFIVPGLYENERRFFIPGIIGVVILFLLGNLFGYMMLRNMTSVLFGMFGSELEYLPSADPYIAFVVYFLLAMGIAFQLPIALLILVKVGLLSPATIRKQRKIAYFILFVFAELITPVADPIVAPTVVMLPMVLLFELALFLARFVAPKPAASTVPTKSDSGQRA